MRHSSLLSFLLTFAALFLTGSAFAQQEFVTEKLDAARIRAAAPLWFRGDRLRLGLPEIDTPSPYKVNALCSWEFSEKITCTDRVWTSYNAECGLPNWVAWEVDLTGGLNGSSRDKFRQAVKAEKWQADSALWAAVINLSYEWAWEKPYGETTVVCGPMVGAREVAAGSSAGNLDAGALSAGNPAAVPYAFFAVICKRVPGNLGFKSLGFIIPNGPRTPGKAFYDYSFSVNAVELKSGYDFFPRMPAGIQEKVEEMTTYELLCPFVEFDDPRDDPDDWRADMEDNDLYMDMIEDIRY